VNKFGIGIDIGSTTAKGILVDSGMKVLAKYILPTGATVSQAIAIILKELESQSDLKLDNIPIISSKFGSGIEPITSISK
jgi:activator of 2-hydroxyglutaryl-CoA dehydratase